jgi:hypothetical protein
VTAVPASTVNSPGRKLSIYAVIPTGDLETLLIAQQNYRPVHGDENRTSRGRSREQDRQQESGDLSRNRGGTTRRNLVLGGAGLAAVLGGGWFLFLRTGDSPEPVAEEFVAAIDDTNFSRADEFVHPDSPLDGAGTAADLLLAVAGVGRAISAVDISATDTETTERGGGEAVVRVTVEIDLVVDRVDAVVPLEMRTDSGDWYVWNVDV